MASGILPFRPLVVRCGVDVSDARKSDQIRRTSPPNWWSPLFGFSSEPDYINPNEEKTSKPAAAADEDPKPAKIRFAPGAFTEEKARRLRRMTNEAASSHDMYHSAIASRLASDFSGQPDA